MEIVIRSNDFYTICMCCLNNCFHRIISCKRFYVYKVNQSCFCRILIQFYISFCLNGFLSAFFGCTECEQDRSLTKYLTKSFHCLFCLCKIENIFIPVYTPLNNIGLCRFDSFCCCKDFFSCYPNDRYTDFRDSCTNFNISYFYSIHNTIPFYDFFGGEPAPVVLLRYRFHFYNFLIYASSAFFRSTPYLTFTKSPSATPTAVRTMFITITWDGCIFAAAVRIV